MMKSSKFIHPDIRKIIMEKELKPKFKVGDMARKPKGYEFPCTIVSVFKTKNGNVRVVGEMDNYGLLHIFNEDQLIKVDNHDLIG